jgi:hypothetical protein
MSDEKSYCSLHDSDQAVLVSLTVVGSEAAAEPTIDYKYFDRP